MRKSGKIIFGWVLVLLIACPFQPQATRAENIKASSQPTINEHKIITIHNILGIKPLTATIKKGATIIWVNESQDPVEIVFSAKQVSLACKKPTHFITNKDGFFMSNSIPEGAVASLCFVENGKYGYVVKRGTKQNKSLMVDPAQFSGTIIVE